MNQEELINAPRILFPVGTEVLIKGKIVGLKAVDDRFVENVVKLAYGEQIIAPNDAIYVKDEPEAGHADEAPRYVKNILARLRELPLHNREVWLKAIMGEFEQDFSHAKWREGYEQGKFEGMVGREKVTVPQYIADKIEYCKKSSDWDFFQAMDYFFNFKECSSWLENKNNQEIFAQAWIFGNEVEKEKRYKISVKSNKQILIKFQNRLKKWFEFADIKIKEPYYTRKELEQAGFGWVFSCEGIEIEEVE